MTAPLPRPHRGDAPDGVPGAVPVSWPLALPLRTARLRLEPLTVEHAPEMTVALAPPGLYRFTGGGPPGGAELRARYARQSRGHSEDRRAGWLNWVLRPEGGGSAIGFVQATLERPGGELTADLAWLVTPSEQGHGFASEAARAVVAWLGTVDVRRYRCSVHPDNAASARVAERVGFAPTTTVVDGEVRWEAGAPGRGGR